MQCFLPRIIWSDRDRQYCKCSRHNSNFVLKYVQKWFEANSSTTQIFSAGEDKASWRSESSNFALFPQADALPSSLSGLILLGLSKHFVLLYLSVGISIKTQNVNQQEGIKYCEWVQYEKQNCCSLHASAWVNLDVGNRSPCSFWFWYLNADVILPHHITFGCTSHSLGASAQLPWQQG